MSWSSATKNSAATPKTGRAKVLANDAGWEFSPVIAQHKVDWKHLVTLDMETFWDQDYTLSKMSTSEYVRDKRFRAHMVGLKIGTGKTRVIPHEKISAELRKIDWKTHDLLCHNTAFDGFILSHHEGIVPRIYYDTLSMARGLFSNDIGASLGEVGEYLGLGGKIEDVLIDSKGVHTLSKPLYTRMAKYCGRDVDLCLDIFKKMLVMTPESEIKLIHLTVKMFADPVLKVNIPRVEKELARELAAREALLMSIDVSGYDDKKLKLAERSLPEHEKRLLKAKKIVGSSDQFSALITALGVEVPVKLSPAWMKLDKVNRELRIDDKWAPAFAKDDADFIELPARILGEGLPGYNRNKAKDIEKLARIAERMQQLIDVRLAVKSTTNITRAQRFLTAGANGMLLPVGYAYARAHCLLGEAEVLTPTGWKRLDVWDGSEQIMQWGENGSMDFVDAVPNKFQIDEDMVIVDSRYHQIQYTKGHRIPAYTSTGTFKLMQAGNLLDTRCDIPIAGVHDGDADISVLDMKLAAMMQADGNICLRGRRGKSVRFGFRKKRKIVRCKEHLTAADIPFTESVDSEGSTRIRIASADVDKIIGLVGGEEKMFSLRMLRAPLESKLAFLEELSMWDGKYEPHGKGFSYMTTNKLNAELVHTLAHMCGKSAYLSSHQPREARWAGLHVVYIRGNKKTRVTPAQCATIRHTGEVYCPTVPTGFFLVRQNGLIVVTGNTLRWGGNNKMNMQNLKRGGELRLAIEAPAGHVLSVVDSGQIECRVNGWLWDQDDLMDDFRNADSDPEAKVYRDAYCNFGDLIYGKTVTKADKMERFVGKVAVLGLGFQMGAEKFQGTLAKGALGGPPVFFPLDKCKAIVNAYRRKNYRIAEGWKRCTLIIEDMAAGRSGSWKCLNWEKGRIWGPDGTCLKYPNLKKAYNADKGWDEWTYEAKGKTKKIYGGLLCENIVQWLARMVVATQMLEIAEKHRVVMMTHDEVVAMARKRSVEVCYRDMMKAMRRAPAWCADIPLNCEGGYAENYSK